MYDQIIIDIVSVLLSLVGFLLSYPALVVINTVLPWIANLIIDLNRDVASALILLYVVSFMLLVSLYGFEATVIPFISVAILLISLREKYFY